ncbi:MAG: winged helix-turn-helix domain-containing protein, partial [Candidatus Acidiferrales bacterium]
MPTADRNRKARFGAFEADLRAGELRKHGIRLKLQDQPFQILELLLEHPGDVVTREEIRQKLWPADTFVDFDTSLNSAIMKLRNVLGDSADDPRYIETVPRHGYRFIALVENGASAPVAAESVAAASVSAEPTPAAAPLLRAPSGVWRRPHVLLAAGAAVFVLVAALVAWRVYFARPVLNSTDVILVTNFVNKTGDPIFDGTLDKA